MSERSPDSSRKHFPHGFDPEANYADIGANITPGFNTSFTEIERAHMIGVDPRDGELLWCVHDDIGRSQTLSIPPQFFYDDEGEAYDADEAENRVLISANLIARAPWN